MTGGPYVIGCDVGSQGTNAALYAADGTLVASAYEAYDLSFPHPSWAEQDPTFWTAAIERTVARLVAEVPEGASAIKGLVLRFATGRDGGVRRRWSCAPSGDDLDGPAGRGSVGSVGAADVARGVLRARRSEPGFVARGVQGALGSGRRARGLEGRGDPDVARDVRPARGERRHRGRLLERLVARAPRSSDARLVAGGARGHGDRRTDVARVGRGYRIGRHDHRCVRGGDRAVARHRGCRRVRRRDGRHPRRRRVRAR